MATTNFSTGTLITSDWLNDVDAKVYDQVGIDDNATSTAITINSSENVGVNTTDIESWPTGFHAIEFPLSAFMMSDSNTGAHYISNAYYDSGSAWKYKSTGAAASHVLFTGTHEFRVAASGTIDTALTWTAAATIANDGGLYMSGATGGSKGIGTINATAVYDDNVLLTCYVFDAALDGTIDKSKWHGKVPDRILEERDTDGNITNTSVVTRTHQPMEKFSSRLGGVDDPLDLDKYINHWKTKRHLTSLPNETKFMQGDLSAGEWVQRLIETVEIQAVHIAQLHDRLKVLEGA